jgi:hypothetical protein
MNGIRIGGVPEGTKWANIEFVFFVHPKIIRVNQIGRAIEAETTKCLVEVKVYGVSPKILLIKIKKNVEFKIIIICLFLEIDFISFFSLFSIIFIIIENRDSDFHNFIGKIIIAVNILNQFN